MRHACKAKLAYLNKSRKSWWLYGHLAAELIQIPSDALKLDS